VHAKSKLKKASRRLCGDHLLPAAVTPHLFARSFQSLRVATVSPISTQARHRLGLHLPAKVLRTRLAEGAQALYLHDSLRSVPAMAWASHSHRLVPRAPRILHLAACMARPRRTMLTSKPWEALPTPAARHCFRDLGLDPCLNVAISLVAHPSARLCLQATGWLEETERALCKAYDPLTDLLHRASPQRTMTCAPWTTWA
jgi:hypothetical protein